MNPISSSAVFASALIKGFILKNILNTIASRYTKQGLWSLFLMCVFPQHLWTLILVFRDMSWLIERTNVWDAIGDAGYAMVFAFFESLIVFCVFVLVGFITPGRWEVNRRIAFLTLLLFIASIWGMVAQLLYLWNIWLPWPLMQFIASTGRPLVMLYILSLAIVVPTVFLPVYAFVKSKKALHNMLEIMDRLSTLSMLYLFFDLVGLVIVIIRNV